MLQSEVQKIREDFPIFQNQNLVYLDNAATTQMPEVVLDEIVDYYSNFKANVGRSSGIIANKSLEKVEKTRISIHEFLNSSQDLGQVIFTSGTTESLNLIALSLYKHFKKLEILEINQIQILKTENIEKADSKISTSKISKFHLNNSQNFKLDFKSNFQVIVSQIEHHSNFLVWTEFFDTQIWELEKVNLEKNAEVQNENEIQNSQNLTNSQKFQSSANNQNLLKLRNSQIQNSKKNSNLAGQVQKNIQEDNSKNTFQNTFQKLKFTQNLKISSLVDNSEYLETQMEVQNEKTELSLELSWDNLAKLINSQTKIIAISHCSNLTGQILPIKEIIKKIRIISPYICVVVDGSQAAAHTRIDLMDLDADFYVLAAHKMFGPTGIGVIWGKNAWLEKLEPPKFGGGMVQSVAFESQNKSQDELEKWQKNLTENQENDKNENQQNLENLEKFSENSSSNFLNLNQKSKSEFKISSIWQDLPHSWEVGSLNIAGILGFGVAIDCLEKLRKNYSLEKYENELWNYLREKLCEIDKIRIIQPILFRDFETLNQFDLESLENKNTFSDNSQLGKLEIGSLGIRSLKNKNSLKVRELLNKIQKKNVENPKQTPILTFWHEDLSSFDLAEILSLSGICLRSGSFCCQPFVQSLESSSLLRVSMAFYNTKSEIDFLIDKLKSAIKMLE